MGMMCRYFCKAVKSEILAAEHFSQSLASTVMALASSIFLAVAEDVRMKRALLEEGTPHWVNLWESIFAIAYAIEIALRVLIARKRFFNDKDRNWNLFELFLAIAAVIEIISSSINLSAARPLRVFRMVRVLRVFKVVPAFDNLRLMIDMVGSALLASGSALLLLTVFNFIFALFFMGLVSDRIAAGNSSDDKIGAELRAKITYFYGSVITSLVSLIGSISGGTDWFEVADPLHELGLDYCYYAFIVFIVFMAFGILNVLTAVVLESTQRQIAGDKERAIDEERSTETSLSGHLKAIMKEADTNCSETISFGELEGLMTDPVVLFYMHSLGLSRSTAVNVFRLLHEDSSDGDVAIEKFVNALVYYHNQGTAKYVDITTLLTESAKEKKRWAAFVQYSDAQFTAIKQRLEDLPRRGTVLI